MGKKKIISEMTIQKLLGIGKSDSFDKTLSCFMGKKVTKCFCI